MGRRGPKRNKHQKAQHQAKAAELRSEGKTFREIAAANGISYEQARLDLKELDEAALKSAALTTENALQETLAKLRLAQVEALKAWHASKLPAEEFTTKHTSEGVEESTKLKGQSGNPGHMRNFTKAVEAEAKLRGLYEMGSSQGDEASELLSMVYDQILEAQRRDSKDATSAE